VMAIALCFAECAGRFTRNGASYVYAREAFGEFGGFEVGLMSWAVRIIAWAAMAMGFVTALSAVWPAALHEPYRTFLVLFILLGLSTLNVLGVQPMKLLNNLVTVGKLLPLALFVGIGAWFIHGGNFHPMFPQGLTRDGLRDSQILDRARMGLRGAGECDQRADTDLDSQSNVLGARAGRAGNVDYGVARPLSRSRRDADVDRDRLRPARLHLEALGLDRHHRSP